jgi:hypothetical protein
MKEVKDEFKITNKGTEKCDAGSSKWNELFC